MVRAGTNRVEFLGQKTPTFDLRPILAGGALVGNPEGHQLIGGVPVGEGKRDEQRRGSIVVGGERICPGAQQRGNNITVFLPREGAQAVIDVMAIPADAKHPQNAHAFINFMMRPDVVGPITNAVGYANAVNGAEAFVDQARLDDPVVYPNTETRDRLFVVPLKSPSFERQRTRIWTRIKTGQ